ncbi:MAG: PLP-dependent aminotransferase family protein [Actinobacteria bacterium]|nr:PLP-dependent aminotransferase family protein [Actinomycetota bacterium]
MNNDSGFGQLAEAVAREIEPLPAGTRIPTHRELVRRFSVSATTVAHALSLLAQQGLIESRPGAGSYRTQARPVARAGDTSWQQAALELAGPGDGAAEPLRRFDATGLLATLAAAHPDVIDLNGGYLHPELQPLPMLSAALSRAARRPAAWDRPAPGGLPDLRDWFAADIGGGLGRHDILVGEGGQNAMATALRALTQPGDPVVVESPTYPGTVAAARAAGLHPVAVPLDGEGMRPDYLDEVLGRTRARVVAVQPQYQNPTGISLSPQRGQELVAIARQHGAFVIEDDYARHMTHQDAGPVPPPLIAGDADGVVVHIRSLTKVTSPNLRVGALAARGPVMARLRAAVIIDTMLVPAPLQFTALEVVTAPGWRRALATLAKSLRHRRGVATSAVTATFGPGALAHHPRGGYHLWVALPAHADSRQFAAAALASGVCLTPGDNYYPSGNGSPHVRISYSAAPAPADINDAIGRLSSIMADAAT